MRTHRSVLPIVGCLVVTTALLHAQSSERAIAVGAPVLQTISGADVHAFTFQAGANSMVTLVAMQDGVDVVVVLRGPDGKVVAEVDSPNGTKGPERLHTFIETAGAYRGEIRRLADPGNPASGRYEATLVEVRAATEAEHRERREQETVLAAEEQWESALERHDAEAVGRLIADDGVSLPTGPGATDKAAQMAAWTERFKVMASATEVHDVGYRTTRLFGDTAVTAGGALITITDAGRTTKLPGRFIHVWQKRGEAWKLVVDHFYPDGSVPETRAEGRAEASERGRISGRYESLDGTRVNLGVEGAGLALTPLDEPNPWKLLFVPETPTEYFSKAGDFQIAFLKGASPADDKLLFINSGRVNRMKRVAASSAR